MCREVLRHSAVQPACPSPRPSEITAAWGNMPRANTRYRVYLFNKLRTHIFTYTYTDTQTYTQTHAQTHAQFLA